MTARNPTSTGGLELLSSPEEVQLVLEELGQLLELEEQELVLELELELVLDNNKSVAAAFFGDFFGDPKKSRGSGGLLDIIEI